jgi:hypothetical protein
MGAVKPVSRTCSVLVRWKLNRSTINEHRILTSDPGDIRALGPTTKIIVVS